MSNEPGLQMNRRHFFSRTSAGLGGAVLSNLMVGARNGRQHGYEHTWRTALPGQSQAGDLPVPERGSIAVGDLRLQAAAKGEAGPGITGLSAPRPTINEYVGQPIKPAAGRLCVSVQKTWQMRHLGE